MPMGGVRIERDVGHHHHLRHRLLDGLNRAQDESVLPEGGRSVLVLQPARRASGRAPLPGCRAAAARGIPWPGPARLSRKTPGIEAIASGRPALDDEQRRDKILRPQRRLLDEGAYGRRPAQAAGAVREGELGLGGHVFSWLVDCEPQLPSPAFAIKPGPKQ